MAIIEMVLPKMGESVMEGTILSWLKQPGDEVEEDDPILEVATDKVDTEIPSAHDGVLKECLVKEGDVVEVGTPIAIIATEEDAQSVGSDSPPAPEQRVSSEPAPAPEAIPEIEKAAEEIERNVESASQTARQSAPAAADSTQGSGGSWKLDKPAPGRFYSPLVMNIAREEGIGMAELEYIPGTGAEGRVTKRDVLAYLKARSTAGASTQAQDSNTIHQQDIGQDPEVHTGYDRPVSSPSSSAEHQAWKAEDAHDLEPAKRDQPPYSEEPGKYHGAGPSKPAAEHQAWKAEGAHDLEPAKRDQPPYSEEPGKYHGAGPSKPAAEHQAWKAEDAHDLEPAKRDQTFSEEPSKRHGDVERRGYTPPQPPKQDTETSIQKQGAKKPYSGQVFRPAKPSGPAAEERYKNHGCRSGHYS